jgi:hypothetical protein
MTIQKKSLTSAVKTAKKGKVASASANKGNSASVKGASSGGVKRIALGRYAGS